MAPPHELISLQSLQEELEQTQRGEPRILSYDITGLRDGVLAQSAFLACKSAHVFNAAQADMVVGRRSWARFTSYHAAFFAMKAVLGLLGVTVFRWGNDYFQVDVWSTGEGPSRGAQLDSGHGIQLTRRNTATQKTYWYILQRVLRTLDAPNALLPHALTKEIQRPLNREFALQRNALLYSGTAWPFQDLLQQDLSDCDQGLADVLVDEEALRSPAKLGFLPALAAHLVRAAGSLIDDASLTAPALSPHATAMRRYLSQGGVTALSTFVGVGSQ